MNLKLKVNSGCRYESMNEMFLHVNGVILKFCRLVTNLLDLFMHVSVLLLKLLTLVTSLWMRIFLIYFYGVIPSGQTSSTFDT